MLVKISDLCKCFKTNGVLYAHRDWLYIDSLLRSFCLNYENQYQNAPSSVCFMCERVPKEINIDEEHSDVALIVMEEIVSR